MTPKPKVLQRDIARALREAKKHGAKRIHVDVVGGGIDIFLTDDQMLGLGQHPTPPRTGPPYDPPPGGPKRKVSL
jgi:hypothetical protein